MINVIMNIKEFIINVLWLHKTFIYNKDWRYLIVNTEWEIFTNLDLFDAKYCRLEFWSKNLEYFINKNND